MKYVIDIPDDKEYTYVNAEKTFLRMPISLGESKMKSIFAPTMLRITPYTESDIKAIEDEVWKFVQGLFISQKTNLANYNECYHGKPLYMVITDLTYEEAKAKYDEWKKQKDEIHVGDEVIFDIGNNNDMKAIALDQTGLNGEWSVLTENGCVEEHDEEDLYKTGKHFNDVEELLKKMSEDT